MRNFAINKRTDAISILWNNKVITNFENLLFISKNMPKKLTKRLKQNDIKFNRKLTKRKIRIEISFDLLNN